MKYLRRAGNLRYDLALVRPVVRHPPNYYLYRVHLRTRKGRADPWDLKNASAYWNWVFTRRYRRLRPRDLS